MTTTALAFPDDFDREAHHLLRWAGATLADPATPTNLTAAVKATVTDGEVFVSRTLTPKARTGLARLNRNQTAAFKSVMNLGRRGEVA